MGYNESRKREKDLGMMSPVSSRSNLRSLSPRGSKLRNASRSLLLESKNQQIRSPRHDMRVNFNDSMLVKNSKANNLSMPQITALEVPHKNPIKQHKISLSPENNGNLNQVF